jgi:hypothetical protein
VHCSGKDGGFFRVLLIVFPSGSPQGWNRLRLIDSQRVKNLLSAAWMRNNSSLLSADGSPQNVRPVGVRRLNHILLYIVGGILAAVGLLVAWVATEKGKEQPAKPEDHGGSANDFAIQVVGDKVGYVRAGSASAES